MIKYGAAGRREDDDDGGLPRAREDNGSIRWTHPYRVVYLGQAYAPWPTAKRWDRHCLACAASVQLGCGNRRSDKEESRPESQTSTAMDPGKGCVGARGELANLPAGLERKARDCHPVDSATRARRSALLRMAGKVARTVGATGELDDQTLAHKVGAVYEEKRRVSFSRQQSSDERAQDETVHGSDVRKAIDHD